MSIHSSFDLTGKVALITGASKGIGEAMARLFAAQGATVVINSRKQEELDAVAESIRAAGGSCTPIAANTGNMSSCQQLIQQALEKHGNIDILVNNAAANPVFGPIAETEEWAFDKIMQVNVKAPFELSKLVYPVMKANGGGSIINVSSVAGLISDHGLGMYAISKAALNMLTKVTAKEWGKDGIRVNAICPGWIKTKFSEARWQDENWVKQLQITLPAGRMGTVEEIACLALFLVSDAAGYCTGAVYMADGGLTI